MDGRLACAPSCPGLKFVSNVDGDIRVQTTPSFWRRWTTLISLKLVEDIFVVSTREPNIPGDLERRHFTDKPGFPIYLAF